MGAFTSRWREFSNKGPLRSLVGANFLFEMLSNMILSPVIVRLIRIGRKEKA